MAGPTTIGNVLGSAGGRPQAGPAPGARAGFMPAALSCDSGARTLAICLLLFGAVLWVFFPAIRNGFVDYDDNLYVYQNLHVQGGLSWEGIKWTFTNLEAAFWHPLTWLTFLLDFEFYGLQPWGYHLTNVLLHAANTVLLFVALRRLTGAAWRSVLVAALFGLHPLHVESVAWISQRKDVISTLFWILTMLMYARYVRESRVQSRKSKVAYGLTLLCFVCGLLSKPMVVTLPLVLLLLDWWPLQRFSLSTISHHPATFRRLLWEKVPFLAVAVVVGGVTIYGTQALGGLGTASAFPLSGRVQNALLSYLWYLEKTLWPAGLAVFYPYPGALPAWRSIALGLAAVVISVLLLRAVRRRPYLAVGWIWYVVTLLPMIGLIQVGKFARADRFTYVPLIGVFLALVWGACDWARRRRYGVPTLVAAGAGAAVLCGVLTRHQIAFWKDDESLWRHAVAVAGNSDLAHYNLGVTLGLQGNLDEAIRHLEEAIRLKPAREEAHSSLAYAYLRKGRSAEAIREYEAALRLNPGNPEAHNNLGNLLLAQGRRAEAMQHYREALRLDANYAPAHFDLGAALMNDGLYADAAAQFREVLRLNPEHAKARQGLDQALAGPRRFQPIIEQYRQALASNPRDARAHLSLGRVLLEAGQLDKAAEQCAEAARLEPTNAAIQYQLGTVLVRKGDAETAARQFGLALKLDPNFATAHYALGILCQQQRRMPEALKHWREAARLAPHWPDPLNNLAWALATSPQAELRNGPEAVRLASRAVELAGTNNVGILDTLAAAYAEAGRFAEARSTASQAQEAAAAQGRKDLAGQIGRRLALYSSNQPYRISGETR